MVLWNTIPPTRPLSLKAYLLAVTRKQSLNKYHSNTAQKRNSSYVCALEELEGTLSALGNIEDELEAKELSAAVNRFLGTLPKQDRQIFVCRYWLSDPVKHIAEKLGMKPAQVSLRLFRIRSRLKQFLIKEGYEP